MSSSSPPRSGTRLVLGATLVLALALTGVLLAVDREAGRAVARSGAPSNVAGERGAEPELLRRLVDAVSGGESRVPEPASASASARALARGSLELVVVDAGTGEPLADLPFVLFCERPRDHAIALGRTDSEGRASFAHLPEDLYLVGTLRRPPLAEAVGGLWLAEGAHEELRIEVGRGGAVKGRVVDDLGRPLEGVELAVSASSRPADFWEKAQGEDGRVDAVTDAEGRYCVTAVVSEPQGVWIVDGELRPERWNETGVHLVGQVGGASGQVGPGETVELGDIAIDRPVTYAGRVVDERGAPIQGALVSADWRRPGDQRYFPYEQIEGRRAFMLGPGMEGFHLMWGEVLTDAAGRFELGHARVRSLRIWTRDGRVVETPVPGLAPGKRADDLEIVVPDRRLLRIEVVDRRGERVTGRHPLVWQQNLRMENPKGGHFGLTAVALGVESASLGKLIGSALGLADDLVWDVQRAQHDGDGILRLPISDSIVVREIEVTVPGYSTGHATLPPSLDGTPVRVGVEALPTIAVRLVAPEGWEEATRLLIRGYAGMRVCAKPPEEVLGGGDVFVFPIGCGLGSVDSYVALEDLPGEYVFPVVDERPFNFYLGRSGARGSHVASYGPFRPSDPTVHEIEIPWTLLGSDESDAQAEEAEVPPAPSSPSEFVDDEELGRVAFQVVDSTTGEPVSGAVLDLERVDGTVAPFLVCDRDGEPQWARLKSGDYVGCVRADGYRSREGIRFGIAKDERTDLDRVELVPLPRQAGRVLDAKGRPVPHASVTVFDAEEDRGRPAADLRTDDDGCFSFRAELTPPLAVDVTERGGGTQSLALDDWRSGEEIRLELAPTYEVLVRLHGPDLENESVDLVARSTAGGPLAQIAFLRSFLMGEVRGARALPLGPAHDGRLRYRLVLAAGEWELSGGGRRSKLEPFLVRIVASDEPRIVDATLR